MLSGLLKTGAHIWPITDYPIWEVITNGNGPVSITTDTSGQIKVLPPRTAEEIVARERERKARTTLLMALPEDHLAKFIDGLRQMKCGIHQNDLRASTKALDRHFVESVDPWELKITGVGCIGFMEHRTGEQTRQKEDSNAWECIAVPPPIDRKLHAFRSLINFVRSNGSKFTYGPKQTQPSESESQSSEFDTCESNISAEPSELVSEPVVNESNVKCQPKVWSDAPIIEEYESDSEDECVSIPTKQQETPSFANKQVKTPRENVKRHFTHNQKPKVDKKDLGYGFTVNAVSLLWGNRETVGKPSNRCNWRHKDTMVVPKYNGGSSLGKGQRLPADFQDFNGGPVAFGCSREGISLNKVLFTDSECLVLSSEFKLPDEDQNSTTNGVAKVKDMTLIEAERTRLAILSLPTLFEGEAVSTVLEGPNSAFDLDYLTDSMEIISNKIRTALYCQYGPSYSATITPDFKADEKEAWPKEGAVADFTNLETVVNVSPIPTSRIHSTHPKALILGDPTSAVQTRSKLHKSSGAHAFVSYVQKQRRNNHKDSRTEFI
ncbi:hypothetical protein Tco_0073864 [Tanacetum coccineum]